MGALAPIAIRPNVPGLTEGAKQMVRLGSSGLKVSRLCLGCVSYGTPAWRPWVLDEATSRPFFREEIEAGITFFDTANMYSLGVSEIVTGRALRDFARRDEIVLATKVYYPLSDKPNDCGLSRKHIMASIDASRLLEEPYRPRAWLD